MLLRGFKIVVKCEDKPLPEYRVRVYEDSASCYIPSEAGKVFSVDCHHVDCGTTDAYDTDLNICIDGCEVGSSYCFCGGKCTFSEVWISKNSCRSLVFSKLQVVEDEVADSESDGSNIGSISVRVYRYCEEPTSPGAQYEENSVLDCKRRKKHFRDQLFSERSKKAGMHRIALGPKVIGKPRPAPTKTKTSKKQRRHENKEPDPDLLEVETKPFATFTFHYKPRSFLQAQEIIPPEPALVTSTAPIASKRGAPLVSQGAPRAKRHRQAHVQLNARQSNEQGEASREDVRPALPSPDRRSRVIAMQQGGRAQSTSARSAGVLLEGAVDPALPPHRQVVEENIGLVLPLQCEVVEDVKPRLLPQQDEVVQQEDVKPTQLATQSNAADLLALNRRRQAAQQQLAMIEAQIAQATGAGDIASVKTEVKTEIKSEVKLVHGEVIDLTLDD